MLDLVQSVVLLLDQFVLVVGGKIYTMLGWREFAYVGWKIFENVFSLVFFFQQKLPFMDIISIYASFIS